MINIISFLTLDLPKPPLFKDNTEKINIPQIDINVLFKKFDGETFTIDPIKGNRKRYKLLKMPKNLILYFKRFEKNMFFVEKNPTIVNFPLKHLSVENNSETSSSTTFSSSFPTYDLIANIIHDGKPKEGTYRIQVKHKSLEKWFNIQDLVINEIMAQSVVLSESLIHFYESSSL